MHGERKSKNSLIAWNSSSGKMTAFLLTKKFKTLKKSSEISMNVSEKKEMPS